MVNGPPTDLVLATEVNNRDKAAPAFFGLLPMLNIRPVDLVLAAALVVDGPRDLAPHSAEMLLLYNFHYQTLTQRFLNGALVFEEAEGGSDEWNAGCNQLCPTRFRTSWSVLCLLLIQGLRSMSCVNGQGIQRLMILRSLS